MIFTESKIANVFIIRPEKVEDSRGFFARTWCTQEFLEHGLNTTLVQCNISFNLKKGTLRGMHYQAAPYEEAKLVRCTRGSIYDVVVDLRPQSVTYKKWIAVELSSENRTMLYIPEGLAHGFQTLEDDTEVFYQMTQVYSAESSRGVRWNDTAFGIEWPVDERTISLRDQQYPDFTG